MRTSWLTCTIAFCCSVFLFASTALAGTIITVNDIPITTTHGKPNLIHQKTFVPIRAITDALKAYVEYNIDQQIVTIQMNQQTFQTNGKMEGYLQRGRLFLPVNDIASLLHLQMKSIPNRKTIALQTSSSVLKKTIQTPTPTPTPIGFSLQIQDKPLSHVYGQPFIKNGQVYVSLRSLAETMNATITTNEQGMTALKHNGQLVVIPILQTILHQHRTFVPFVKTAESFGYHVSRYHRTVAWYKPAPLVQEYVQEVEQFPIPSRTVSVPFAIVPNQSINVASRTGQTVIAVKQSTHWQFIQMGEPTENGLYRYGFSVTWENN